MVTVYRSVEMSAEQDATTVKNLLMEAGLNAVLCDDNTPGIPDGTFEVRVPSAEAQRAQSLVPVEDPNTASEPDVSRDLDMVPIIEAQGVTGEIEALGVQSILDANGINAILVGSSSLPNLSFQVQVAKDDLSRAETALAEAREAGPAAAVEAARESEAQEYTSEGNLQS